MQCSTVRDILNSKGYNIWSVSPGSTVYDALSIMSEKNIGALLVMEGERLAGIMSERDYARKVILLGKTSRETLVSEIMSKNVFTIDPEKTIEDAMDMMYRKHIRHLPVIETGKVVGIISISDIVRAVTFKQREAIKNLENKLLSQWQH